MSDRACEILARAIEAHGLQYTSHGEYFEVDGGNLWIRPDVYITEENESFARIVLEFTVVSHSIGDKAIREAFAGSGATVDSAVGEAFGKFLLGSFHVLIEALTSHACEAAQAEVESWGGWKVFSGPLLTQHSKGSSTGSLLAPGYGGFLSQLQVLFEAEANPGPHWIRVFLGAFEGKIIGGEVLLDNETWESAQRKLFDSPWDCPEEYQSLRHFVLALPGDPEPAASVISSNTEVPPKATWWHFWKKGLGGP